MNPRAAPGMLDTRASQYLGRVQHPLFTILNGAGVRVEGDCIGKHVEIARIPLGIATFRQCFASWLPLGFSFEQRYNS